MAKTCEMPNTLVSKIVDNVDDEDEHESSDEEKVDMDPVEVDSSAPVTLSGSSSDASAKVKPLLDSLLRPTASERSRK